MFLEGAFRGDDVAGRERRGRAELILRDENVRIGFMGYLNEEGEVVRAGRSETGRSRARSTASEGWYGALVST